MNVQMVSDSIVDARALNFPEGAFGTCVNGQTFQQEAMVSFAGFQYAGYYAEGGVLCLARRKLPEGSWQVIRFEDYRIGHTDAHNVVVVGICPGDGTIHLAFDHHNDPLHYRRSIPGLALRPEQFKWEAAHFGAITSELEPGKPLQPLTYPTFFTAPGGALQMLYRLGSSGDGDWYLAEYEATTSGWTLLGKLISRAGVYETSASRSAYPNPVRYDSRDRLHITWCWRERPEGGPRDLRTNHDLCYAFSDDLGRTWKNNDGQVVAVLGGEAGEGPGPISLDTPGIVVRNTRYLWGQMNTTTEFVDYHGRVHVIHWQHQQDAPGASADLNTWRYYHYWRGVDGQWHENRLPFYGRKPQIVLDDAGRAYVVFGEGENRVYHGQDDGWHLTIATATEDTNWTEWTTARVSEKRFVGEPLLDLGRWSEVKALSIYAQEKPLEAGAPSPLHVLDLRVC